MKSPSNIDHKLTCLGLSMIPIVIEICINQLISLAIFCMQVTGQIFLPAADFRSQLLSYHGKITQNY